MKYTANNKTTFKDVPVGQIFSVDDVLYFKIPTVKALVVYSCYRLNINAVALNKEPNELGAQIDDYFKSFSRDKEIDKIYEEAVLY